MLKLEKNSRDGSLSVRVRDKDFVLTEPFLIAFALAAAIHLGLFFLFQIAPLKIGISQTIFPPTSVEAAPLKDSAVADIFPLARTLRGLPEHPIALPETKKTPKFLTVRPLEYQKEERDSSLMFKEMEVHIYQPQFYPLISAKKLPFQLKITGLLSEIPVLSQAIPPNSIPTSSIPAFSRLRAVYAVIVEGKTGKIFWFEPKEPHILAQLDLFAEKTLKEIRFQVDPEKVAISGEIEFHFNGVEDD